MKDIEEKLPQMISLLERWVNINSHWKNGEGIEKLLEDVKKEFSRLKADEIKIVPFAKSKALFLKKREKAPIQIYFGGHLDTVFPLNHPFQKATFLDANTLNGPGVTDMKGGLVVLLMALEAFEKTENASFIGWEIFLNSDEEIGSPDSTPFIEKCAERCDIGLLFEPCLDDGSLVSKRKGSANYKVVSRGKKAHTGRNPQEGKNAIYPLAHFIVKAESVNDFSQGILASVGVVSGGEANNIVPDYAECELNVRADSQNTMLEIEEYLEKQAAFYGLEFIKNTFRPPKPFDSKTEALFQALKTSANSLRVTLSWRQSGGVCDGNTFASKGVAAIDTLGVQGGMIHTDKEYVHLPSLKEKTELTLHFLKEIASGKITVKSVSKKEKL